MISELNGTIALDGQRVVFDSLAGSANGGALTLDGGFLLEGFTPTRRRAHRAGAARRARVSRWTAERSRPRSSRCVRATPGWTLEGDVRVERSVYSQTISLAGASSAQRRGRAPVANGAARAGSISCDSTCSSRPSRTSGSTTTTDGSRPAPRCAWSARWRIPVLAGRVTLREGGEVYVGGNTFRVSRGSHLVHQPEPDRAGVRHRAAHRSSAARSSCSRSKARSIGCRPTCARPIRRSTRARRCRCCSAASRARMRWRCCRPSCSARPAARSASTRCASQRGFDTDEFRADPGLIAHGNRSVHPPDAVEAPAPGRRADPVAESARERRRCPRSSATSRGATSRSAAVSRDNVDRSVALRHEITFGGAATGADADAARRGRRSPASRSPASRAVPRRSSLKLLKLEPGDRFDFYRWQQDIDALRERLSRTQLLRGPRPRHAAGRATTAQTVALEYRIEPGPIAELVDRRASARAGARRGHPRAPGCGRSSIGSCSRTSETRITRHLLEEKIDRQHGGRGRRGLHARAKADSRDRHRRARRSTSCSVRYTGNAAVKADRLDAAIDGGRPRAWTAGSIRRKLAEALKTFYRNEGYLSVRGHRGCADRSRPASACSPVTIVEGPRFTIYEVTLAGVSPERQAAVANAVRINPGMPFVGGGDRRRPPSGSRSSTRAKDSTPCRSR